MPYTTSGAVSFVIPKDELDAAETNPMYRQLADNSDIVSASISGLIGRDVRVSPGTPTWTYKRNISDGMLHKQAIDELDRILGDRVYTPAIYLVDGESVTQSLDRLQVGISGLMATPENLDYLGAKMGLDPYTAPSSIDPAYSSHYAIPTAIGAAYVTLEAAISSIDIFTGDTSSYSENSILNDEDGIGNAADKLEKATTSVCTVGDNVLSFGKYQTIQDAINAVASTQGTVVIKRGNYFLSQELIVPVGVTIMGEGHATKISFTSSQKIGVFKLNGNNHISNLHIDRGTVYREESFQPTAGQHISQNYSTGQSIEIDSEGNLHILSHNKNYQTGNVTTGNELIYEVYRLAANGFTLISNRSVVFNDSGITSWGWAALSLTWDNRPVIATTTIGGPGPGAAATTLKFNYQKRDGTWGGWTTVDSGADPKYLDEDSDHGFWLYTFKKKPRNQAPKHHIFYIAWKNKASNQIRIARYVDGVQTYATGVVSTGGNDIYYRQEKEIMFVVEEETEIVHMVHPTSDGPFTGTQGNGAPGYWTDGGRIRYDKGCYIGTTWTNIESNTTLARYSLASCCITLDPVSRRLCIGMGSENTSLNGTLSAGTLIYVRDQTETSFTGYRSGTDTIGSQEKSIITDALGRIHLVYNVDNHVCQWLIFDLITGTVATVFRDSEGLNFHIPMLSITKEGIPLYLRTCWEPARNLRIVTPMPTFTYADTNNTIKNVRINNGNLMLPQGSHAIGVQVTFGGF